MNFAIDISGLGKADLLAALVNGATPRGMGWIHDPGAPMTSEEARQWIEQGRTHDSCVPSRSPLRFDYVHGRPIKSDIGGDTLNPTLYDRDHGQGAAALVVAELRASLAKEGT
jgi:hypothetical protein